MSLTPKQPENRNPQLLILVAIIAISLNLRPAVNGLGVVIPEIRTSLGLSGSVAGALTSLPVLCFALLGLVAPTLAIRWGPQRVIVAALVALTIGQLIRTLIPGTTSLFLGSILALSGLALCNVLMPGIVRRYFPDRIATVTAVYTTCLAIGAALSAALTIPIEDAFGGNWQLGTGIWAATAAVAVIPWVLMAVRSSVPSSTAVAQTVALTRLLRSPLAWGMAVFFGLQAMQAYIQIGWQSQILVDDGMSATAAGVAVGVYAAVGIPLSAVLPIFVRRESWIPGIVVFFGISFLGGYLGLMLAPSAGVWLWVTLLGIGSGTFPLALTLVALRARTHDGVLALSAFTQCVGYLIAGSGPIAFGALHDVAGGWGVPIATMMALIVVMTVIGLYVARPRQLEDQLGALQK